MVGGTVAKLVDDAENAVPSPDGSRIAFIRANEIWLARADGDDPRRIASAEKGYSFEGIDWSPNGERLADLKVHRGYDEALIESRAINGNQIVTILSDPLLRNFCWSPDGRILYTRLDKPREASSNIWDVSIDQSTERASFAPRRLTNWAGFSLLPLTVTANGKRIAFSRQYVQSDVYVGDMAGTGVSLSASRRLTLDDRMDWPGGWSRDNRTILFFSDRNGTFDIFKQPINGASATEVVVSPEEKRSPQLSPDGSWILYLTWPKTDNVLAPAAGRLMRVPASGGTPELVSEVKGYPGSAQELRERWAPTSKGYPDFRCPLLSSASCVLSEVDQEQIVFFAFDPLQGRKGELARIDADPSDSSWDLSPDGSRIAFVKLEEKAGHIRILDLASRQAREITLKGWNYLTSVGWASDGRSLLVAKWASRQREMCLLRVTLNGDARVILRGNHAERPVPSPDGRHLVFGLVTYSSNAWMVETLVSPTSDSQSRNGS